MAKIKLTGHASGTGILTITAPNTSTDRTITLPDATGTLLNSDGSAASLTAIPAANITGTLPAISGASLTNLPAQKVNPNILINGGMQIAQRSLASGTANDSQEGYGTVDRFSLEFGNSAGGAIMAARDHTTVPDGFGFSYHLNVTTAATASSTEIVFFRQSVEAQSMRSCGWDYTDSNADITLSFWVYNNKTGIYCVAFQTHDGTSKMYTVEYTVSSSNTWEKKTITIPGDSGISFDANNNLGLTVYFMLDNASGRYGTAGSWATGNHYGTSNQVNFLDSTSNNGYWTGLKLEVGDTATDFVHKGYGEELTLCQRYYQTTSVYTTMAGFANGTSQIQFGVPLVTALRASPTTGRSGNNDWTAVKYDSSTNCNDSNIPVTSDYSEVEGGNGTTVHVYLNGFSGNLVDMRITNLYCGNKRITFDAEL